MDELVARLRTAADALPAVPPEPLALYSLLHEAAYAIARLSVTIHRIDGINDNPADYNSEINAECDRILRPDLVPVVR